MNQGLMISYMIYKINIFNCAGILRIQFHL